MTTTTTTILTKNSLLINNFSKSQKLYNMSASKYIICRYLVSCMCVCTSIYTTVLIWSYFLRYNCKQNYSISMSRLMNTSPSPLSAKFNNIERWNGNKYNYNHNSLQCNNSDSHLIKSVQLFKLNKAYTLYFC